MLAKTVSKHEFESPLSSSSVAPTTDTTAVPWAAGPRRCFFDDEGNVSIPILSLPGESPRRGASHTRHAVRCRVSGQTGKLGEGEWSAASRLGSGRSRRASANAHPQSRAAGTPSGIAGSSLLVPATMAVQPIQVIRRTIQIIAVSGLGHADLFQADPLDISSEDGCARSAHPKGSVAGPGGSRTWPGSGASAPWWSPSSTSR